MGIKVIDKTDTLQRDGLHGNVPKCIVLHSTRSYFTFEALLAFHRKRGFAGVGYHFFVSASREIYQARPIEFEGAHSLGFNTKSIGVCIFSKDGSIDDEAVRIGRELIKSLKERSGDLEVTSHTAVQLEYVNELIEREGIRNRFKVPADITEKEQFTKTNISLEKFLHDNPGIGEEVTKIITGFKNCPGPMFSTFAST